MELVKAIVLGIIQGLTEFLPISSSGHLVIGSRLLNFQEPGIFFEVFLHCGTLFAVILVFRGELLQMLRSLFVSPAVRRADPELSHYFNWSVQVVVATLPAVIAGLFLRNSIDRIFDTILITFSMLAVTGIMMVLTKFIRDRGAAVTWPRALIIGVAQALAILPGISRSGSTIFTGMLVGINRETAARFSFIMSIPAILGAVVLKAGELLAAPPPAEQFVNIGAGTAASLVSGYGAIVLLLRIVRRGKLYWFGYYCLLVSGLGLAWHFLGAG
ncbi:MAG TPA: undecaprenyl-diphosphate phosphatase [Desulfobacteraceae bacterium]|nr:undecaprenyl-diphosphate phosphatase [Desulfobacteraceae bacterium]